MSYFDNSVPGKEWDEDDSFPDLRAQEEEEQRQYEEDHPNPEKLQEKADLARDIIRETSESQNV